MLRIDIHVLGYVGYIYANPGNLHLLLLVLDVDKRRDGQSGLEPISNSLFCCLFLVDLVRVVVVGRAEDNHYRARKEQLQQMMWIEASV